MSGLTTSNLSYLGVTNKGLEAITSFSVNPLVWKRAEGLRNQSILSLMERYS